eukprot:GEMP01091886.1.p1 GENE.GEMP01091886.1~~GEMP01091886.1.p1  ORF type:complete len:134 (-),score=0.58 GEMP01091886.1:258-659(-)
MCLVLVCVSELNPVFFAFSYFKFSICRRSSSPFPIFSIFPFLYFLIPPQADRALNSHVILRGISSALLCTDELQKITENWKPFGKHWKQKHWITLWIIRGSLEKKHQAMRDDRGSMVLQCSPMVSKVRKCAKK